MYKLPRNFVHAKYAEMKSRKFLNLDDAKNTCGYAFVNNPIYRFATYPIMVARHIDFHKYLLKNTTFYVKILLKPANRPNQIYKKK